MLKVVDRFNRTREHVALRSMFEARKRFFVDELGWDLPVLAGLYEVDQFDDGHATYLIVVDQDDRHLASARLLHTIRPSPIESACPPFVEGIVPKGRDVWEITRICSLFPEGSDRVWEVHDMLLNGLGSDLVIGVMLPFSAHCWIQVGAAVLSDPLDLVVNYQPLLTVR